MVLINFAGLPATTDLLGTSCVITLPAPVDEPAPILTPGNIFECAPILTFEQILTSPLLPECTP